MSGIEAVAALQDPMRRRLYEYVAAQDHEVSRNEAAAAVGAQRTLAAFHLDKLVDAGLLDAVFRRLTERTGPGAGRPAKLYRPAPGEHAVSIPPRDYRTPAGLLAEAAEAAGLDREAQEAAARYGRELGAALPRRPGLDEVAALLRARGYEPYLEEREEAAGGPVLRMRNCPFRALSDRFPPLVCGMNVALIEGLLAGTTGLRARMDARPDRCCAVVEAAGGRAAPHPPVGESKNNRT
ncbi:MAG TPA: transcriptional regulator [Streptosporangiaceae bacterium]|nr:transcriptional regulator [Streptosporangiaceae bacterium]